MSISKDNYKILKEKFGQVSGWAYWKEPYDGKPMSNISDLSIFDDADIGDKLGTSYVFVGLNAAEHKQKNVDDWRNFHSEYRWQKDFKLRYALMDDDRFLGSYISDIIKGYPETDGQKVYKAVKNGEIDLRDHVDLLNEELSLLGKKEKITLIVMGDYAFNILSMTSLANEYKGRIIKIPHYAAQNKGLNRKEEYRDRVQEILKYCK